jgi:hypothetical protein
MLQEYSKMFRSMINSRDPLDYAGSLRMMLTMRTRRNQIVNEKVTEWKLLNNKMRGYKFMDYLGVRRPKVCQSNVPLSDISPAEKIVIKPLYEKSSKGVYIVFRNSHIFRVIDSGTIPSWDALLEELRNELASNHVEMDRWITEELILEDEANLLPARDLKFYCFYGNVALVHEIVRFPSTKYCFWHGDHTRVETTAFKEPSFIGIGFTEKMLRTAEKISLEIPTPFISIDFHRTASDLVFCEFSPRPGAVWRYEEFIDQMLGDAYLAAEGRLFNDLMAGRKFNTFARLKENYETRH